jgi:hypothetical protein
LASTDGVETGKIKPAKSGKLKPALTLPWTSYSARVNTMYLYGTNLLCGGFCEDSSGVFVRNRQNNSTL